MRTNTKTFKILKFIIDNDNTRKVEILKNVLGEKQLEGKVLRGYYSSVFAKLRKKGYIKYNTKTYGYSITPEGLYEVHFSERVN